VKDFRATRHSGALRPATTAAVIATLVAGCAAHLPQLPRRELIATRVGRFVVEYSDPDASVLPRIAQAVEAAGPAIGRWGELSSPVKIELLPSHELLEKAVDRQGYDWLRAWARYDEVFIQSPRSWGYIAPTQSEVSELLTHELTHCMMYQQSADRQHWSEKGFPLWFREGMASYTTGQGYRWPTLEELARFLETHPKEDPIRDPEPLYQSESDIVYSAAHHAFAYLVQLHGEPGVRQILHAMRPGPNFGEAFRQVTGIRTEDFTAQFKQYVEQRHFRSAGYRSALRIAAAGLSRSGGRSLPSIAR
jgi:hypothetical protein